ncbi:hypothetical protein AVM11_12015 [Sphingomonas melonis TY]|jgi:23S rRNA (cytidine1920-2'-O)/16S rRNA (cytidine1409-2'-O)-methyltransferase|uniref:TlyA family RNA methyltransferase n=2 Tax=Sphingomonas TaxID=13687 RepID=A0A7Y7QXA1_9SPHN|nr:MULTISPECIES: TlyA family RNA methyltransferase [Sphingomonas]AOW24660.1 hypothetical protein BJP26_14655 [Sphingomonas melonis TY]KZB93586.1 hypothetical protein AVM11_12015 [Sphingomonas melonis TY]MBZ6383098.1 TlyA family RNA methyltransferase [Sphingomonas sanguinis]NNG48174.1 TlyA family RNA methyltransferase [Sphingomonas sanguinis]NNG54920.1 TlyA family RNA methyltransferase [Sphingomonas sanguinis]
MVKAKAEPKTRLDEYLVRDGRLDGLKAAQAWIMSGKVVVDGIVITKPGTLLARQAKVSLRGIQSRFASRGGFKLEKALSRFGIDVGGLTCMDAGASTGGFTDCLLQHGAAKVYAVEVGYGQLLGRLALDPRVVSLEKTNVAEMTRDRLDRPLDFACGDLSYLSLTKAVPILADLFDGTPHLAMLVKPLYEGLAQDDITNPAALEEVLDRLVGSLGSIGHPPSDACVSPIKGGRGAIEFLFHFGGANPPVTGRGVVIAAMDDLVASPPVEDEAELTK